MNSFRSTKRTPDVIHAAGAVAGKAFTLVELLVVIVIIILLAALAVPAINSGVERARQTACRARMKNLYDAAATYGSENRNLVPLVQEGTPFGGIGKILPSGGRFAERYLKESVNISSGYAIMRKEDNAFQCPSALGNLDNYTKTEATNYRLSGFGLDVGSGEANALHPSMLVIGGSVQKKRASGTNYRVGQVAMAIDWIWSRKGEGLSGYKKGAVKQNHRDGANVLYGSGAVSWFSYDAMLKVSGVPGFLRPPGTYGFIKGGSTGTHIFTPEGSEIPPGAAGDRKPGAGVMW